jgi:hypothetical protein
VHHLQVSFSWVKGGAASRVAALPTIDIPVYLNSKRISLLFSVAAQLPEDGHIGSDGQHMSDIFIQRGVGLVLWD